MTIMGGELQGWVLHWHEHETSPDIQHVDQSNQSSLKHRHITKADIVADVATKLIKTIKGNYAAAHNNTEIEALNRLSQVFFDATKKLSGVEIKTAPEGQAPRVENRGSTPRVEQRIIAQLETPTKPPPRVQRNTTIFHTSYQRTIAMMKQARMKHATTRMKMHTMNPLQHTSHAHKQQRTKPSKAM
ncbi:hypothetical protein ACHAW6_003389 [Cyclotella cf. meneghiniana]